MGKQQYVYQLRLWMGITLLFVCTSILYNCTGVATEENATSTHSSGMLKVYADLTYKPLLETLNETFESNFPKSDIQSEYFTQEVAIKKLLEGNVDVILSGRKLLPAEEKKVKDKGLNYKINTIAYDALVFITSKDSEDTLLTESELVALASGKASRPLVCDQSNSTNSTQLQAMYNLPAKLTGIVAAGSDSAVIEYVSSHKDAIGIIGMTLVSDYDDPKVKARMGKAKILAVEYKDSTGKKQSAYPVQSTVADGSYPFIRSIFIINLDGQMNLGTGFANFVAGERGQRLVLKSGLMPYQMPGREIIIQ